jgi:hypothetical protein
MIHGDEVIKVRLPQIRSRFLPSEFAQRDHVHLVVGDHAVDVKIETRAEPTCFGGARRWVVCPRCGRKTTTICFSPMRATWGCYRCLRYRSRTNTITAPNARCDAQIEPESSA